MTLSLALAGLALGAASPSGARAERPEAAILSAGGQPASWDEPVAPFRIVGGIYYVGTRGLAAYLLTSKTGAVLIDGTTAENAPLIERNIRSLGVRLRDVKLLLIDHAHADHVGAIAQIKRDTGAPLAVSAGDRWALENGQPRGDNAFPNHPFAPAKVDRVVGDGETVGVDGIALTAHLTPGHTPGCTSWSTEVREAGRTVRVLFLCSLTVAGNTLVGNRAYPTIADDYRTTFRRLDGLQADVVLTSHPEVADVLGRARRRKAGDRDAFIDPSELPALVAGSRREFEKELAAAGRSAPARQP